MERRLTGVSRSVIELEESDAGDELGVSVGLVRVSRIEEPAILRGGGGRGPEPVPEPEEPRVEAGVESEDLTGFEAGEPEPEPDPEPEPVVPAAAGCPTRSSPSGFRHPRGRPWRPPTPDPGTPGTTTA